MALMSESEFKLRSTQARAELKTAWASMQDAGGLIPSKKLYDLTKAVKLTKTTGRANDKHVPFLQQDCNFVLESFGLSPFHIAAGVYLRYETVEKWYLAELLGDRGDHRNVLLMRSMIGVGKGSYHRLPPASGIAFGAEKRRDGLTADALLHNLFAKDEERGLTAYHRMDFPLDAAHPPVKRFLSARARDPASVFGASSAARTPISDIITAKWAVEGRPGTELAPDRTYAAGTKRPSNRIPIPRPTRSSQALRETQLFRLQHGRTGDALPSLAYSKLLSATLGRDRFGTFSPRPATIHL